MARSIVYLAAMARTGTRGGFSIILVEMAYVTVTAGLYAGMQQKALGFRSRLQGNLTIVLGVPILAQILDWLTHRAAGVSVSGRALFMVSVFAITSALFHLHVMRKGAFLTGNSSSSLRDDLRRMPRLAADFVLSPIMILSTRAARLARVLIAEAIT